MIPVSPQQRGRVAGALYLFSLVTAAVGELYLHGRLEIAVGWIVVLGMAAMMVLFYTIFKIAEKRMAMLAVAIGLVGLLFEALRFKPQGVDLAIVLNGFFCLVTAILIFQSKFMPRILAAPMVLAGVAWLSFQSPTLASRLSPWNLGCGILGEAVVMLWLLVAGLDEKRWWEQADPTRQ